MFLAIMILTQREILGLGKMVNEGSNDWEEIADFPFLVDPTTWKYGSHAWHGRLATALQHKLW